MILSEYCLRAHLRDNEVPTVINVPTGMTRMLFSADQSVYARRGTNDAETPDTNQVNDGSASFPYPPGLHEVTVAGSERYSFVTQGVAGTLFVSFD